MNMNIKMDIWMDVNPDTDKGTDMDTDTDMNMNKTINMMTVVQNIDSPIVEVRYFLLSPVAIEGRKSNVE